MCGVCTGSVTIVASLLGTAGWCLYYVKSKLSREKGNDEHKTTTR